MTDTAPTPLPLPIRRALRRLELRLRTSAAVRGLGTTALVAAVVAALSMAADFTWPLPAWGRWVIWGGGVAVIGGALATAVAALWLRRIRALDLAAFVEVRHPELGERLTAAVALLGEHRQTRPHGSPALIAALAAEAAACVKSLDPRLVPWRPAVTRVALGAGALGFIILPGLVWQPWGVLLDRLVVPWSDRERVGWLALTVAPGDHTLTLGSDLNVSARVGPRLGRSPAPEEAWLEWNERMTGSRHRLAMTDAPRTDSDRSPARSFSATLPRLTGAVSYRVVCGSDASRLFRVAVIEPPTLTALSARVEPPAYTHLPAATVPNPSQIDAWEGSRISLKATTSTPVRAITVEFQGLGQHAPGNPPALSLLSLDRRSGSAELVAETSGALRIVLRDEHGGPHVPQAPLRVVVHNDEAPALVVVGDDGLSEARPNDVLKLDVAARDDVAIAAAELRYTVRRGGAAGIGSHGGSPSRERGGSSGSGAVPEVGRVALKMERLGTASASGIAVLALESLKLRHGDTLSYHVQVADNYPAPRGPHVVSSSTRTLGISAAAERLEARRSRAGREALQAQLDAVKAAAAANRSETEQLRYAADAALRNHAAWDETQQQKLHQSAADARSVSDRLEQLARDLNGEPAYRPLAAPARRTAKVEAAAGRTLLEQAQRAIDASRRLADLRAADAQLTAVTQRLDALQGQFDALGPSKDARGTSSNPVAAASGPAAVDSSALPALERRAIGRAWGVLPPHLRSEILQGSQRRYRDEYARLIRLYFREIGSGTPRTGRSRGEPAP